MLLWSLKRKWTTGLRKTLSGTALPGLRSMSLWVSCLGTLKTSGQRSWDAWFLMLKMAKFKPIRSNMCQKKNRKLAVGCQRAINLHKRNFSLFMFAPWEPQWFWLSTCSTGSFTEENMLSLSSIKLRRTPHGHGRLIQLAGENRLKRLWFAAFSTRRSLTYQRS